VFVADVKCSQATWQTVPNSRTGSAKAYSALRSDDLYQVGLYGCLKGTVIELCF